MERSEIPHDPRHLGVPLGASKMISDPTVRSTQTVHLSCVQISIMSERPKRGSTSASSPSGTIECVQNDFCAYGTLGAYRAPILHRHQHYLQMNRKEIPHYPHHLGVPSGMSKTISESMFCLAPTVHLSCTDAGSQQTKMRFHLTHVT